MLGVSKVITPAEASEFWGVKALKPASENLPYSFTTLRFCSRRVRFNDWRIVYTLPLSFRQQFEILKERNSPETFSIFGHQWWLEEKEQSFWVDSTPEEGYYLIDIYSRFKTTNWKEQTDRVNELGHKFCRADERVYSQLILATANIYNIGFLQKINHWGDTKTHGDYRVALLDGHDFCSLKVFGASEDLLGGEIGTCIARKWDY
jgi:hypothetical protein